jgi:dihydroorotate dehydrogenase electron transfer subunit
MENVRIGMKHKLCRVKSCTEAAANTFLMRFVSPEIAASAKPGQFVNVLAAGAGETPLLRRPFSISRIDDDIIELLFNVVGTGTSLLSRKQSGDTIDVIGPLGRNFGTDADYDTAIIAAGGIGTAPFPFLTEDLKKRNKKIVTFAGFRNSEQIYTEHLENIHLATDDGSKGFHGTIVQMLGSFLDKTNFSRSKIFACGPTAMLRAMAELADKKGISCEVSLEEHMACGIGICQGCPVERKNDSDKYALVCKDGPIFLTTEIKF